MSLPCQPNYIPENKSKKPKIKKHPNEEKIVEILKILSPH